MDEDAALLVAAAMCFVTLVCAAVFVIWYSIGTNTHNRDACIEAGGSWMDRGCILMVSE